MLSVQAGQAMVRNLDVAMAAPDVVGATVSARDGAVVVELLNSRLEPVVNVRMTVEAGFELADRLVYAADELLKERMTPTTLERLAATIAGEQA